MEFPLQFYIGGFPILLHAIFEIAAFFIGFRYFLYLRRKQQDVIDSPNRIWIIIGAIFGALIGSRVLGALEQPSALMEAGNVLLYIYSNKTVVGGFLGGLAGVELIKKKIGEKKASGDLFVFPMILALCIGRLGCFSMGVYEPTFGIPTSQLWGMDLGDGINRHPVALYEIIFLIMLWVMLTKLRRKAILSNGALFKLFMIAYLLFRFGQDFIKPHNETIAGLTVIQLACITGLLYYSPFIIKPKKLLEAHA
ncbi:MAG TPA: prolipoprotein diacylglyceryl transferase family protein [Chitinophagaceae bacterium]